MSGSRTVGAAAALDLTRWVEEIRGLLRLEREEETQRASSVLNPAIPDSLLQAAGLSLPRLEVLSTDLSLFGRPTIRVGVDERSRADGGELPPHRFSSGDLVGLVRRRDRQAALSSLGKHPTNGVVLKVGRHHVDVAVDLASTAATDEQEAEAQLDAVLKPLEEGDRVRMDLVGSDVTHKLLGDTLVRLQGVASANPADPPPARRMLEVLFRGTDCPRMRPPAPQQAPQLFNAGLNASQRLAVAASMRSTDVCLIHGPPGTGKTTTVVEIVRHCLEQGLKVLACAPSNTAVDNLLQRVLPVAPKRKKGQGASVLRLGHPARVADGIADATLDHQVRCHKDTKEASRLEKQERKLGRRAARETERAARKALWAEQRQVRRDIRRIRKGVSRQVIRDADVVMCTLSGAGGRTLGAALQGRGPAEAAEAGAPATGAREAPHVFDVVIVDEVGQATEVAVWTALLLGRRCVLAGDHCQLPPTVLCDDAASGGLALSLADRVAARYQLQGPASGRARHGSLGAKLGRARLSAEEQAQLRRERPAVPEEHLSTPAAGAWSLLEQEAAPAWGGPASDPWSAPTLPCVVMLDTQYRMSRPISEWCSQAVYGGKLGAADSVALRTLPQLLARRRAEEVPDAGSGAAAAAAGASGAPTAASKPGRGRSGRSGRRGGRASAQRPAEGEAAEAIVSPEDADQLLGSAMVLLDTTGLPDCEEQADEALARAPAGAAVAAEGKGRRATAQALEGGSKRNELEARVVANYVQDVLLRAGLRASDVAVITPYNSQVDELRRLLAGRSGCEKVEVRSVDGFQGQEREVVVLSLVRSNAERGVGFLKDWRRINVAVTRARRQVCVVCHSATVNSDPFVKQLLGWIESGGVSAPAPASAAPGGPSCLVRSAALLLGDQAPPAPVKMPEPKQPKQPKQPKVKASRGAAKAKPEPVVAAKPEPVVAAKPVAEAKPEPEPVVAAKPEPAAEAKPEPVVAAKPEPAAEAKAGAQVDAAVPAPGAAVPPEAPPTDPELTVPPPVSAADLESMTAAERALHRRRERQARLDAIKRRRAAKKAGQITGVGVVEAPAPRKAADHGRRPAPVAPAAAPAAAATAQARRKAAAPAAMKAPKRKDGAAPSLAAVEKRLARMKAAGEVDEDEDEEMQLLTAMAAANKDWETKVARGGIVNRSGGGRSGGSGGRALGAGGKPLKDWQRRLVAKQLQEKIGEKRSEREVRKEEGPAAAAGAVAAGRTRVVDGRVVRGSTMGLWDGAAGRRVTGAVGHGAAAAATSAETVAGQRRRRKKKKGGRK